MSKELIVGIDLGTTNSEIAVFQDGQPRVIREDGKAILPSIVGLDEQGRLLVGEPARNQWLLAPHRTVRSVKRRMGEDVQLPMGDQKFHPQEISAIILRTLKDRAERDLGREVRKAVITVPAYFQDHQRRATHEAGELAGLEVVRILNEPTAAALTYEAAQQRQQKVLVYDLGGGTFDVSVVSIERDVIEVLASHGDTHLGGDDFDALLLDHVAARFQEQHGVDLRGDPRSRACLWRAVEQAKMRLSTEPFAMIEEGFIAEKAAAPLHLSMEIARDDYENMIQPLLEKTMDSVQAALKDCALTVHQIDRIILAGGATRTPLVGELLRELTGHEAQQVVDPDLCVALGAAIQAGMIAGEDVRAVLVDVSPFSFGISHLGLIEGMPYSKCFTPIIGRNTPLPASRTDIYSTFHDNQEAADIEVYQGEDRDALKNTHIGRFTITGLSRLPAGNEITCQLDLNLDGMLKVTAREKRTSLQKHIVIDNALAQFESQRMQAAARRLRGMFAGGPNVDDREKHAAAPAAAGEAATPPDAALSIAERARRLLPEIPEQDRQEVHDLIARIEAAGGDPNWKERAAVIEELENILFYLQES